jgi:hypothetical protein
MGRAKTALTCGSERQDFAVMALFDASGDVMPASRSRRLPPRFDQSLLTIPEELTWGQTVDRLGADIKLTIAGAADKLGAAAGAAGAAAEAAAAGAAGAVEAVASSVLEVGKGLNDNVITPVIFRAGAAAEAAAAGAAGAAEAAAAGAAGAAEAVASSVLEVGKGLNDNVITPVIFRAGPAAETAAAGAAGAAGAAETAAACAAGTAEAAASSVVEVGNTVGKGLNDNISRLGSLGADRHAQDEKVEDDVAMPWGPCSHLNDSSIADEAEAIAVATDNILFSKRFRVMRQRYSANKISGVARRRFRRKWAAATRIQAIIRGYHDRRPGIVCRLLLILKAPTPAEHGRRFLQWKLMATKRLRREQAVHYARLSRSIDVWIATIWRRWRRAHKWHGLRLVADRRRVARSFRRLQRRWSARSAVTNSSAAWRRRVEHALLASGFERWHRVWNPSWIAAVQQRQLHQASQAKATHAAAATMQQKLYQLRDAPPPPHTMNALEAMMQAVLSMQVDTVDASRLGVQLMLKASGIESSLTAALSESREPLTRRLKRQPLSGQSRWSRPPKTNPATRGRVGVIVEAAIEAQAAAPRPARAAALKDTAQEDAPKGWLSAKTKRRSEA